jgi:hypothetical protein
MLERLKEPAGLGTIAIAEIGGDKNPFPTAGSFPNGDEAARAL